mmetsp:Transcript_12878/g.26709  ORF Transcript_12878/g.26709 Transcript_12878/m.26709 type:complete len:212 (+) Transcript_12878:337-972(+)
MLAMAAALLTTPPRFKSNSKTWRPRPFRWRRPVPTIVIRLRNCRSARLPVTPPWDLPPQPTKKALEIGTLWEEARSMKLAGLASMKPAGAVLMMLLWLGEDARLSSPPFPTRTRMLSQPLMVPDAFCRVNQGVGKADNNGAILSLEAGPFLAEDEIIMSMEIIPLVVEGKITRLMAKEALLLQDSLTLPMGYMPLLEVDSPTWLQMKPQLL